MAYEPLLLKYGVDIVLSGHVHAYERSDAGGIYDAQPNACGPVYLNLGDGGNREGGEAAWVAGDVHLANGNLGAARDAYDRAVHELPRSSALWVDVARFRDASADMRGARDAVDYAIELDAANSALPTSIYYDAEGREIWRVVGAIDWQGDEAKALLAALLEGHGINAQMTTDPSQDESAVDVIERQIAEQGADLLVMGLYGRPRLQELILGGVSRAMVAAGPVPIFASH